MPTYPGGKAQAGVYQAIICQLPPHSVYIEPFLGAGAIMRYKRPAARSIGIDLDPAAIAAFSGLIVTPDDASSITDACPGGHVGPDDASCSRELIHGDALAFLRSYPWTGSELVYADPPYLMDTRSSDRPIYACEFATMEQHSELLDLLSSLPAMVAISGYWSQLYGMMIGHWRSITFEATTRGGTRRTEWLWMNYPEPDALHDYRYLGGDFRERQRIQRKIKRWEQRLASMPRLERLAMMAALQHRQIER